MDESLRYQITQVFVAGPVLTQQHQMVWIIVDAVHPIRYAPTGNIDLAAYDGLDPGGFCGFIEVNTTVHHAVVGDGNGGLSQLLHPVHDPVDAAGAVQKAVFGMDMQMYKAHGFTSSAS